MKINLIVALDLNHGFSKDGEIPWIMEPFAREDLKHFRTLTMGHTVIMGRKTYEDISKFTKVSPILPGRECVILSRNPKYFVEEGVQIYSDFDQPIENYDPTKEIFFIGGYSVFVEAFKRGLSTIYLTRIQKDYKCDKQFPFELIDNKYKCIEDSSLEYPEIRYLRYDKI